MSRKHSIEYVKKEFSKRGYVFTDSEYLGVDSRHTCLCVCGRPDVKTLTNVRAGKKCMECRRERFTGESNPRWNPNLTDEERIGNRDYTAYLKWREGVFEYFDYTCDLCGEHGGKINAHHIVPYSVDRDLRTNVDNGVALCVECHKKIHSDIPLKEMDASSYIEYENYTVPSSIELEIGEDEEGDIIYDAVVS